jgi:hypothetical protein
VLNNHCAEHSCAENSRAENSPTQIGNNQSNNIRHFVFLLGNSAKLSLDQFMPDIQINKWIDTFHQYKFDKLSFEPLFKRALLILKDTWLRCIKEDVDSFTVAYYITSSPSQSINESEEDDDDEEGEEEQNSISSIRKQRLQRICSPSTQIQISDDTIYIKRPWLNRFLSSAAKERQKRLLEGLEMTEEERQRLRAERLERLRKIEQNRKKALKAARDRRKRVHEKGSDSSKTRRYPGLYIDQILPTATATLTKEVQRLFLTSFQRYIKSSKTATPKLEHKLTLVFEIAKVLSFIL